MVFRHISKEVKERTLWLLDHDYIPEDVAEILGVSKRSVARWKAYQEEHGSVIPPHDPQQGRPRFLTAEATRDVMDLVNESPEMLLEEIRQWIAVVHDLPMSRTALHENLSDLGITYKRLRKVAAERDEEVRQEWINHAKAHWVGSQLVFVDETSKDDRTIYRHYGRSASGSQASIQANFVRGTRYSIVAALGLEGYIGARVVEGSIDGEEFFDFIAEDIVYPISSFYHRS